MASDSPSPRAVYMRRWRAEHGEQNRRATRARKRALERLADMHPDELTPLVNEERASEGLPPLGVVGPGRPRKG